MNETSLFQMRSICLIFCTEIDVEFSVLQVQIYCRTNQTKLYGFQISSFFYLSNYQETFQVKLVRYMIFILEHVSNLHTVRRV